MAKTYFGEDWSREFKPMLILRALNDFLSRAILGYRGWRCGGQRGAAGAYDCQR